jgi:transposase
MLRWLTRVPETIGEAKAFIQKIATEEMSPILATYRLFPMSAHYGGIEQRWLLVYSQEADKREQKQLLKRIEREKVMGEKQLKKLERRRFNCEADAQAAVIPFAKSLKWHLLESESVPIEKHTKPGRPLKGAVAKQVGWRIKSTLHQDKEKVESTCQYLGRFILATNELDTDKLSDEQMLTQYKEQSGAVERGFRFLKDPMFFADSLFVKSPVRIMAMIMIMGLSLLVYSLAEREMRQQLEVQNETLPSQTGKPTKRITMRRVAQIFEGVDVLVIRGETGVIISRRVLNLTPLRYKILKLFDRQIQNCYLLNF